MENQKRRLTKTVAENAVADGSEYVIWDSAIAGFGLRVRPTGAKSWVFIYRSPGGRRGKVRRVTIKATSAEKAREQAKALAGTHHGGMDPAGDKAARRAMPTVGDVLDRFLADHADARLKPKTAFEYRRLVEKVLKPRLGHHAIDDLAPKHVAEAYHDMRARPTQAASAVRVLSSAMSRAIEWGFRDAGSNPARIRLKGSRRRERLFSDNEVSRLQKAVTALEKSGRVTPSVALAIRLLFATGCRAGEIMGLAWSGVDFDAGFLRWSDTKTGALSKPITPEARRLLQRARRFAGCDWVSPSPSLAALRLETLESGFERAMAEASVEAGENATLHLIRHWFATKVYSDPSIPLPLQMAIVGHKSVATAMRYTHVAGDAVKRAAQKSARRRAGAVAAAGRRGKVVPLRAGAA